MDNGADGADGTEAGHRVLPHTADVIVEAWAASRSGCLEELVRGVVGTFADTSGAAATREVPLEIDAALDEDVVVNLVDDVVYLLDADGLVVVDVELEEDDDGAFRGAFHVAPAHAVTQTGAVPKGVSRSGLRFVHEGTLWRSQVLVDV
jgi:SHS2 domain-containing protein